MVWQNATIIYNLTKIISEIRQKGCGRKKTGRNHNPARNTGEKSIFLCLLLALEHPKGSLGQSQQLVLAGIDGDGGDPLHHIL